MSNPAYIRAIYDKDRDAYVSEGSDWIEGEPSLEYRFTWEEDEDELESWQGGLEKSWCDDKGNWYGELFVFGEYATKAAFETDVEQIIREAQDVSIKKNIDELLAVTDIVKRRAVALGYEDETIEDLEGLFQNGPEDAYILYDIGDSPRLHHHIEREDECWYLHIGPVVDTEKQPLGWGLFAVHLPDLSSDASQAVIESANRARILILDHLPTKEDAKLGSVDISSEPNQGTR